MLRLQSLSGHLGTLFSLIFLATVGTAQAADPPKKPNVILILADDLGLPAIGCYGGAFKTPNLDALAAGGCRFEHCFSAPLCAPSRALLMTGRYAFRTGVKNNGLGAQATPEKDGCVALSMKQAGYASAVAGKWRQLSHFTSKEDGAQWGFDEFLIWGAGSPEKDDGKAAKRGEGRGERYWSPEYNLNGKTMPDTQGKYGPDLLNQFVIDFIRRHRETPFFVYYPTPLIHSPILPTPASTNKDGGRIKGNKNAEKGDNGSRYADNIAYIDKQVGQLVSELEELKLRENTLIIFIGDNGSVPIGTLHGRKVDGSKSSMREGGSRVPFIANWPSATPKGIVNKDLIDFSDFLPTLVELAEGQSASTSSIGGSSTTRTIDGRSFAPQLLGKTSQPREWAYVQLGEERYVRNQGWKLTGGGELYDMSNAPFEQVLVPTDSDKPEAKAARLSLQTALDKLHSDTATADPVRKKKRKKS